MSWKCLFWFIFWIILILNWSGVMDLSRGSTEVWNHISGPISRFRLVIPLVLLGLRATPMDDTGLSVPKAVYGSHLTLPGELADVPELPPDTFLRKVKRASDGFAVPPPQHVRPVSLSQLPAALVVCFCTWRCSSTNPGSRLQRTLCGNWWAEEIIPPPDWFQAGFSFSWSPVFSLPPPWRRSCHQPVAFTSDPPPSSANNAWIPKRVRFQIVPQVLPPPVPVRRNSYRSSRDRSICSVVPSGGPLWRLWKTLVFI